MLSRQVAVVAAAVLAAVIVTTPAAPTPDRTSRAHLPLVLRVVARPPTPRPTRAPAPTTISARAALLKEVVGVAKTAGVTGAGLSGPSCVVTLTRGTGPGTLPGCLAEPGRWITFGMTGPLRMKVDGEVQSNTTIDGRGSGVILDGSGLTMHGRRNIIIAGLTITGCREDGIQVQQGTRGVYLTGLDLSACSDELVAVTNASSEVTLAHSVLHDNPKGILVGGADYLPGDVVQRVTVYDTIFRQVSYRHPMCRYGWVHLDRVTIDGWMGQAVDARFGCRVLITRTWFIQPPGNKPRKAVGLHYVASPGAARLVGVDLGGAAAETGGVVQDPEYVMP